MSEEWWANPNLGDKLYVVSLPHSGLYIRAGFSARFRRLLSLLHESKYVEEMDPQPSTFHRTPATLKLKKNAAHFQQRIHVITCMLNFAKRHDVSKRSVTALY